LIRPDEQSAPTVLGTTFLGVDPQRHNGIKNVLVTGVTVVAATVFIVVADVAWRPAYW
jgi:hypothetical protein